MTVEFLDKLNLHLCDGRVELDIYANCEVQEEGFVYPMQSLVRLIRSLLASLLRWS
jgi:hypothetical protein